MDENQCFEIRQFNIADYVKVLKKTDIRTNSVQSKLQSLEKISTTNVEEQNSVGNKKLPMKSKEVNGVTEKYEKKSLNKKPRL